MNPSKEKNIDGRASIFFVRAVTVESQFWIGLTIIGLDYQRYCLCTSVGRTFNLIYHVIQIVKRPKLKKYLL